MKKEEENWHQPGNCRIYIRVHTRYAMQCEQRQPFPKSEQNIFERKRDLISSPVEEMNKAANLCTIHIWLMYEERTNKTLFTGSLFSLSLLPESKQRNPIIEQPSGSLTCAVNEHSTGMMSVGGIRYYSFNPMNYSCWETSSLYFPTPAAVVNTVISVKPRRSY